MWGTYFCTDMQISSIITYHVFCIGIQHGWTSVDKEWHSAYNYIKNQN